MTTPPRDRSPDAGNDLWQHTRRDCHPRCVVCSPANPVGLGQCYAVEPDGTVQGVFPGSDLYQGYPGLLHGGVTAALLDGVMTNCLFAHGLRAFTAELRVRYHQPVRSGERAVLNARRLGSHGRLHLLRAELRQGDQLKVSAVGKFMEHEMKPGEESGTLPQRDGDPASRRAAEPFASGPDVGRPHGHE